MKKLLFVLSCCWFGSSHAQLNIIQKPIIIDSQRTALSLQYMKVHYGIDTTSPYFEPKIIVIHYTENPLNTEALYRAFNKNILPNSRPEIAGASNLNVASQYMCDQDGQVFQMLPANYFARHTIGLNYCAIGIENIGSKELPLTEAQLASNVQFVEMLKKQFPTIEYVIGHQEYGQLRNTKYWKEKDPKYFTHKSDPGLDFMKKLRDQLAKDGYTFKDVNPKQ